MKVKLLCVLAVSLLASAAARPSADGLHCDWSTEKRGVVTERALEILASGGIRRVERGALLYKVGVSDGLVESGPTRTCAVEVLAVALYVVTLLSS